MPYEGIIHFMRKNFLVFSAPRFEEDEMNEILECLRGGWVGTGPRASRFEKEFAEYLGVKHCVAVNSCTAALHLSYAGLHLNPGDEVIVPALTFGATANAVVHAGGRPVFVDVLEDTLCIDPLQVKNAITARTKAVVVVHFAGKLGPVKELLEICSEQKIALIEDCAHSIETSLKGKHSGTFGISGCFSFYANKNVSTGEGGMLATNDAKFAEEARKLSLHGMSKDAHRRFSASGYQHYEFEHFGFKYNMPDLAAALGLHQLKRIDKNREHRKKIWAIYHEGFSKLAERFPLKIPQVPNQTSAQEKQEVHALHLYQLQTPPEFRDKFLNGFAEEKIGVGVHYISLVDFPLFEKFLTDKQIRAKDEDFRVARAFGKSTVSLPLGIAMNEDDARDVVSATQRICEKLLG